MFIILGGWVFYTIILFAILKGSIWTLITIFTPLIPIAFFTILYISKKYKFAKKYTIFYNNWTDQDYFINELKSRIRNRVQDNPSTIKIKNAAGKYIDELIDNYSDNKMKLSDALYNAIIETNLVTEMNYYEKFKRFKNQMNVYRNQV